MVEYLSAIYKALGSPITYTHTHIELTESRVIKLTSILKSECIYDVT